MDILSHGLWSGIAAKAANKSKRLRQAQPIKIGWAVFWGIFPDLFAFALPFSILFWRLAIGEMSFSEWPRPVENPQANDALNVIHSTAILYSLSHSAVVFLIVFVLTFLIFKRPIWELGTWLLHILIDIPTHTFKFYPTPIFWPVWDWKFNGFVWSEPWFLIPNYLAIIIAYWLLKKKRDKSPVLPNQ